MIPRGRIAEALRGDGPARDVLAIQAFIAGLAAVGAAGLYAAVRFSPDIAAQGVLAAVAVLVLVLMGPRIVFPMYFATWFDNAIPLPGSPLSLNQVLALGFVGAWTVSLAQRRLVLPAKAPVAILSVLTIYAVAGGWIMKAPGAAPSYQQLFYLVVCFAAASTYRTERELLRLSLVLLAITCLTQAVGVWEFITRRDAFPQFSDYRFHAHDIRINGIAKNAIQYAYISVWMIPWAIVAHVEARTPRARMLTGAAVLYLAATALLTYNRQTPIILAAMMVVGVPMLRYQHRALVLAGMAAVALAAAPFVAGRVVERFQQIGGEGRPDISLAIRSDKATAAFDMIEQRPWFGIGLNNFKDIWWEHKQPGEMYIIQFEKGFSHFVDLGYLQILTETGRVGFGLFLLLMATSAAMWRQGRRLALRLPTTFHANAYAALAMGFVQLGLSMFLQDTFFVPRTYLLFGLLFAVWLATRAAFVEHDPPGGPAPRPA